MINAVVAQDDHRALERQASVEKRLANAARSIQSLGVADTAPISQRAVRPALAQLRRLSDLLLENELKEKA